MRIRRMNLDREHLTCVEEFQQEWESTKTSGQFSQQLLRRLLQQLTDSASLERSVGHAALVVFAVAQHPRFAKRAIIRQWHVQQIGQTPAAPESILIDWFESQRIQTCLNHARFLDSSSVADQFLAVTNSVTAVNTDGARSLLRSGIAARSSLTRIYAFRS